MLSVRSVRRIPFEHRWSEDCLKWVQWVPWNRYKDAQDADGDLPEGVPAVEPRSEGIGGDRLVIVNTKETVPRDFQIRKEDAEIFKLWESFSNFGDPKTPKPFRTLNSFNFWRPENAEAV